MDRSSGVLIKRNQKVIVLVKVICRTEHTEIMTRLGEAVVGLCDFQ